MFVCMALGRFSYTAMVPALVESGQYTAVFAGYIGGGNLVGALVGALLSTSLPKSLREFTTMRIALWVAVFGLFFSAVDFGLLWLGFWRFLIGISTGIVMVLGLSLTTNSAPIDRRATAASYVFIGVGLGILFSAAIIPMLLHFGLVWAWIGIALAGLSAALIVQWSWSGLQDLATEGDTVPYRTGSQVRPEHALIFAASFLFSFGIVPHTLYWVDFIARELYLGQEIGSLHWLLVGVFAIVGPLCASYLSSLMGTARALVATFIVLGLGVGLPFLNVSSVSLVFSTILFGSQPAVSTLLAARIRDLSDEAAVATLMRNMILANGLGSAAGGIFLTNLFATYQNYGLIFLSGSIAFALGALFSAPVLTRISATYGRHKNS